MKNQFINQMKTGDTINDFFAINRLDEILKYKSKSGSWFPFTIGDNTGIITAKFWGDTEEGTQTVYNFFSDAKVVRIVGKVEEYNGEKYISINQPGNVLEKSENYDSADYMRKTDKDIPQMIEKLKEEVSKISNPHIKQLLESFSNDDEFMKKYSKAPAGKMWHHDFVGGLLEHVHSLIAISKTVHTSHPDLDLDLLIAACILHDIGKTVEFDIGVNIEITDEGRLYGHISIGHKMVASQIEKIPNFPKEMEKKILHIILSHHGELENGSPVKPMFAEAVAFAHIDDTDATTQHTKQIIQRDESEKTWIYSRMGNNWTYTK